LRGEINHRKHVSTIAVPRNEREAAQNLVAAMLTQAEAEANANRVRAAYPRLRCACKRDEIQSNLGRHAREGGHPVRRSICDKNAEALE